MSDKVHKKTSIKFCPYRRACEGPAVKFYQESIGQVVEEKIADHVRNLLVGISDIFKHFS